MLKTFCGVNLLNQIFESVLAYLRKNIKNDMAPIFIYAELDILPSYNLSPQVTSPTLQGG